MIKQIFTYLILASLSVNSNVFAGKIKDAVINKMGIKKFEALVKKNSQNQQELGLAFRNAAVNNMTKHMQILIKNGVDINSVGQSNKPAIYHAILKKHKDVVKLLSLRENLNTELPDKITMTMLIRKTDDKEIFDMLMHRISAFQAGNLLPYFMSGIDNPLSFGGGNIKIGMKGSINNNTASSINKILDAVYSSTPGGYTGKYAKPDNHGRTKK